MSFLEEEYKNTLEICTYYIENSNLLYLKFWKQEPAAGAEIYGVLFDKIHEAREIIFETHEFRKIEFETHEKKLTLAIETSYFKAEGFEWTLKKARLGFNLGWKTR